MSDPTPIYTEALREAKRRTRKHSDERRDLILMDERTTPKGAPSVDPIGRSTGPTIHFTSPPRPPVDAPLVRDLQQMGML